MLSIRSQMYGMYGLGKGPKLPSLNNKTLVLPPYSNQTDINESIYALSKGYQPIRFLQNEKIMVIDCPNWGKVEKINF